jgi:hypothetical protein
MQAAQSAVSRPGYVILNKLRVDTLFAVSTQIPGFHEETSLITENLGLDDHQTGEVGWDEFHVDTPNQKQKFNQKADTLKC